MSTVPPVTIPVESNTSHIVSLDEEENKESYEVKLNPINIEDEKNVSTILLVSSEGNKYPVRRDWAVISDLISTTLQGDKDAEEIPLGISSSLLKVIIEFMNYKQGYDRVKKNEDESSDDDDEEDEKKEYDYLKVLTHPLMKTLKDSCKDKRDADLVEKVSWVEPELRKVEGQFNPDLMSLITACDKLSLKSLLNVACAKVALTVKGKHPDEIRSILRASKAPDSSSASSSSTSVSSSTE